MSKTGKGLPCSLVNAELDIPAATTTAIGGVKKSATVAAPPAISAGSGAAAADSGTYKVVAHDGYGNIISDSTVVTVS
ncbi:putative major tail protein [Salmonella phage horsemountain]|uniref:Putative major tail protein n=1 Tax=Salmonella phage horsemountain TaxID=2713302 RepID=A0A6G8RQD9_9CAUD|nr:putative major tail protein [Salmonella phage horsemountain]QIO03691.1 putative major tail protein [Salmonella phage horsemountain]